MSLPLVIGGFAAFTLLYLYGDPMSDTKTYVQLAGGVTRDPESKATKIGEVIKFGLAVKRGYGPEDVQFVNVAVFNDGLKQRAKSEVYKGAQGVAVEGWLENRPYNGKDVWEIVADRVGLVEWFAATKKGAAPAPAAVTAPTEYANV